MSNVMQKVQKPNILFVFSDQHRWCDLGCYGNMQVISPNLDMFAKKAVCFENCISNSPVCVPARGSLLTGLLPMRHKAITNDLPIDTGVESIAHVLSENGYHTGYIGKWHLAGVPRDRYIPGGKERLGFSEWKVCNCNHSYLNAYYYEESNKRIEIDGYEPIEQTNMAIDFINRNRDKSWALVLSWSPPHDPYGEVPQKYLDMYQSEQIQLRGNVPDRIISTLKRTFSKSDMIENYKGYYAHITALDEQFGRLIHALEHGGQIDNTLVVYTSDHGDMLGSQGYTNKQLPYEESVKVPLLVYLKGKTTSMKSDEMIGLVDLPVSLLGLLGMKFSGNVDGKDLHRLFLDRDAKGLDECYLFDLVPCHQAADRGGSEWRGIRTSKYTFARTGKDDGFVLFDNENDILQQRNLINQSDYTIVKNGLLEVLNGYIEKYDKFFPWEQLIREYGFLEEWNRSQDYFKLPLLD